MFQKALESLNHPLEPQKNQKNSPIVILGAGVNGLSVALQLISLGFQNILVLSEHFSPFTTSDGAGGLWFPYKAEPKELVREWALETKKVFFNLLKEKDLRVVKLVQGSFFEAGSIPSSDPWWRSMVDDFKIVKENLPRGADFAYQCSLPVVECYAYLQLMMNELVASGKCKFIKYRVQFLRQVVQEFSPRAIVNCLGLDSGRLFDDNEIYPLRGILIRAVSRSNKPLQFFVMENSESLTYLIPRSDYLIIGGTSHPRQWSTEIDQQITDKILQKSKLIEPGLQDVEVRGVWSGLRPYRSSVRLEIDTSVKDCLLIHNYGHGGSGWTLHWGCAKDVSRLIISNLSKSNL